ncbi:hypothetical protein OEG84_12290 [Hoeflea sp. G2-23]|uniref:Uncharacterized protein n=1 Tax=Hoeflea algicola TaxID=2983763 RepID=A0ABT3Z9X1_9HYPH|nr:hypothetical protein [Hoeflea algicola]MCY0148471.1 hypothetical protein [Hoeflea algicola]
MTVKANCSRDSSTIPNSIAVFLSNPDVRQARMRIMVTAIPNDSGSFGNDECQITSLKIGKAEQTGTP